MADRSIVVRIRAEVSGFKKALDDVSSSTRKTAQDSQRAFAGTDTTLGKLAVAAKTNATHINRLGTASMIAGGAIALGIGLGVKSFASFDKAMSGVRAALPDAGAKMDDLRKLAIKLGADSQYSAAEAADGITALAKAGVSASDILGGGLKGALDLAASGQMQVADAAEVAASAMTQFGLSGTQVPHIADLLAAAAGKAQGDVSDMAQALNQAGLIAHQTGLSIEETTGGLAAFASAGLIGSDAGTSFKTMLQRLTPTSQQAKKEMDELGISAYDSQGNFIGLANFAGNLRDAMKDLTPEARASAMAIIFGSDSVRAANVLYNQGVDGVRKWIGEVDEAGYAAKQAATLTDNLSGDIERFGGAMDSVFVQNGSAANGFLRKITEAATGAVNAFGSLPGPVQQTALAVAGIAGGGLLAAGALAKLITSGVDLAESLSKIEIRGGRAATVLGRVRGSAVDAALAFARFEVAAAILGSFEGDIDSLIVKTGTLDKAFSDIEIKGVTSEQLGSLGKGFADLGAQLNQLTDPSLGRRWKDFDSSLSGIVTFGQFGNSSGSSDRRQFLADLGELDKRLSGLVQSGQADAARDQFDILARAATDGGASVEQLSRHLPLYADALKGVSAAAEDAGGASKDAGAGATQGATGIADLGVAADDAAKKIKDLKDSIEGLGEPFRNEREAARNVADAIKKVGEAEKKGIDGHKSLTSADKAALLDDLAQKYLNLAGAMSANGKGAEQVAAKVKAGRSEFIKQAESLGISATAAKKLADEEGLIPGIVKTLIETNAPQAEGDVASFNATAGKVPTSKATEFTVPGAAQSDGRVKGLTTSIRKVPTSHATKVDAPGAVLTKSAVDRVRDSILKVPTSHNTRITVDTGRSSAQISALVAQIHGMPTSRTIMVQTKMSTILDKAGGGAVYGPGSGTSDSIPARLSNGEHVLTAAEVSAAGGQDAIYRLRAKIRAGEARFAQGGAVGYATGGAVVPTLTSTDYRAIAAALAAATNPIRDLAVATSAVTKAQKAYNDTVRKSGRSSQRAKDSLDKLTAAQSALKDLQKDLGQAARQTASDLRSAWTTGWSDSAQWARIMAAGASEIGAFSSQIEQLRKRGLNETLVQQLIGMGADAGSKVATQLLGAGGSSLIAQLNKSNTALTKASDALGMIATKGVGRYAYGGPVLGYGSSTSDSILALLSKDEHVWTAREVAAAGGHRAVEQMRYEAVAGISRFATGGGVLPNDTAGWGRARASWATPSTARQTTHVDRSSHWNVYGPSAEQLYRQAQSKQRMADAIPDWSGMGV